MERVESIPAEREQDDGESLAPSPPLLCGGCLSPVTSLDEAIAVHGEHAHRGVNPHGYVFDIRCFREAWGTTATSGRESWFSWFRGHTWQPMACAHCGRHLGWHFAGPASFFGLIASALVERTATA